jgi:Xaa-Pro dipeptidase
MDARGLDAVVLRDHANFAWYTGGADSRVERAIREGVADLVVTAAGDELVATNAIEAERLRVEQVPEGLEVVETPWYEDRDPRTFLGGGPFGSDLPLAGAAPVGDEVARLRRVLDPDAIERLRAVGADATAALAEAADTVAPGVTERELAGVLAGACHERGLDPTVLLAAGDERISRWRHPLPYDGRVERRGMVVISAQRGGLYANVTRIVELEEPDPEIARHKAACEEILHRMREEATRPGRSLRDAFDSCRRFYAEAGFPGEWKRHHQGGMTGYASREVIATPATHDPIEVGQAFAWNPSITGAKTEETFLLTERGPEVVAGAGVLAA